MLSGYFVEGQHLLMNTNRKWMTCFHGRLLGFERLALYTLNEWLQDLKKNQLPSILGGVGPMYSLVQLG